AEEGLRLPITNLPQNGPRWRIDHRQFGPIRESERQSDAAERGLRLQGVLVEPDIVVQGFLKTAFARRHPAILQSLTRVVHRMDFGVVGSFGPSPPKDATACADSGEVLRMMARNAVYLRKRTAGVSPSPR